jgi:hypothetical protein
VRRSLPPALPHGIASARFIERLGVGVLGLRVVRRAQALCPGLRRLGRAGVFELGVLLGYPHTGQTRLDSLRRAAGYLLEIFLGQLNISRLVLLGTAFRLLFQADSHFCHRWLLVLGVDVLKASAYKKVTIVLVSPAVEG